MIDKELIKQVVWETIRNCIVIACVIAIYFAVPIAVVNYFDQQTIGWVTSAIYLFVLIVGTITVLDLIKRREIEKRGM